MKRLLSCIVLMLVLVTQALADQITLKNGDRVTGKIVKSDGGKLVVSTELLGDISVDLASLPTSPPISRYTSHSKTAARFPEH